ncbi:hypothetical protein [Streptomyces cyaneofuscatus]|uniref:Uncharacterized protein n=1 Tax=Streptomyces cyaneofuscatus TaxID=66883 RepID=A0ABZ1F3E6_9ACTN|nr:hypothetical protein [Streptomyces cyaneofuscatus]WSB10940.1 hypothetical protein OG849_28685 [Streptomyces cyaneofuscatus]WSD45527.1 hypothetical protein OG857_06720 [Streptomyces cyaneofuscatus]WTA88882.1 hypothetical protein OG323_07615 [Streptomyces cyaneofuscatus]
MTFAQAPATRQDERVGRHARTDVRTYVKIETARQKEGSGQ